MRPKKSNKTNKTRVVSSREYHRRTTVVDIEPVPPVTLVAQAPKNSAVHNIRYEKYVESDDSWVSENSAEIEDTPDEFPYKGRHEHEINKQYPKDGPAVNRRVREKKQSYKHEEPVKSKQAQEMKQNNNSREKKPTNPQRVIECYVDKTYYGSPVAVELVTTTENKNAAPIKKVDIDLPDTTPKKLDTTPKELDTTPKELDTTPKEVPKPEHMDWTDYHRLDVIHKFMDDLEYDFPSLCTTGVIGKSIEGRNIKILKISNSNVSNFSVWVDAGIHAREWIAPAVNTYIADHIVRNFDQLPENIRNKDWYFLPVINPDGYEYSHTVDRMWRKNRAWHGGHCVGVDLNRNFSLGWGGKGSSDQPNHNFYRGPRPFSEPESSAIRDMFLSSGIKFKVYITLHSYGQVIIFPYACSSELAPDYVRLLEGATVMSKAIFKTNGNTYKVGISRDVMYGAAGTSNDFSHGIAGIPYCYLIELRSKKHKFRLPKEEIEETGNEILNCVIALMEFVDNYKAKSLNVLSDRLIDSDNESGIENNDSDTKRTGFFEKTNSSNINRTYTCVQRAESCLRDDFYLDRIDSYMIKNDPLKSPNHSFFKKANS